MHSAEIVGVAGIEKTFDSQLRDPAHSKKPFKLTIDLSIQAAIEHVLEGGMRLLNAKGAAAILMEVDTGRIISLVSLPDLTQITVLIFRFRPSSRKSSF